MPPVEFCLGISPSQAANSLPLRNMFGSANRRCDRRGDDRPDPRDGGPTLADWVVLVPRENLRFELSDPCLDIFDLADDHPRP